MSISLKYNISGKRVLWFFMLTNLIYIFMLAVTIPKTMVFSKGLKLLDMMPMGYSAQYIKTLFDTLGEEGRNVYLYNQIPVDMIYPGLFAISYFFLMGYFLHKFQKLNPSYFLLTLLPVLAGIADYLENFGIVTMIYNYPELSELSMNLTNIFTIVKSVVTTIFFAVLIGTLFILGVITLKEIKKKTFYRNKAQR